MDETSQFISKQNVKMLSQMSNKSPKEIKHVVIQWVQRQNGYIPSVSQANEQLLQELQGVRMNHRPLQTNSRDETTSISERMKQMQMERDGLFAKPPPMMPPRDENVLVQKMSVQDREQMTKETNMRLEQMQRERSNPIPIPNPNLNQTTTNQLHLSDSLPLPQPQQQLQVQGTSGMTVMFHSPYAEKKKAGDWWDCEWLVPEIYRMAHASTLEIPYITIRVKQRSGLRRLGLRVKNIKGGGETLILTPNQQKVENCIMYEVREEIEDKIENIWSYHLYPISKESGRLIWDTKTERIEVQLITFGREFGRFWEKDEVSSWSIVVKWSR